MGRLGALALGLIVRAGRAATVISAVLYMALFVWSVDEVVRGVNPWRRTLGAGTLLGMIVWLVIQVR